jgi:broad specificity phosphatase PhoE
MGNNPCNIKDAFDLCAKPLYREESIPDKISRACKEVRQSTKNLAESMDPKVHVLIFSSPVPRAIHTSKIIQEELSILGFTVSEIFLEEELSEVHNFSWDLFEPLMNGGVIEYEGTTFEVNKEQTNPDGLVYPDYFISDAVHNIPESVKDSWPKDYVERLSNFEKFSDVTTRSLNTLQSHTKAQDTEVHTIFVGHDANAMYLADKFTEGRQKGLVPGTSISLENNGLGNLVVTRVGDITDGDSTTEFISEFLS